MLLERSGPRKGSKSQVDEESFIYLVSSVRIYCSPGWLWCSYELRMTLNFSSHHHFSGVGRVGVSYSTRFLWYEGSNSECLLYMWAKYSPMELGWFAWQTSSRGSCIWKLGSQLVAAEGGSAFGGRSRSVGMGLEGLYPNPISCTLWFLSAVEMWTLSCFCFYASPTIMKI